MYAKKSLGQHFLTSPKAAEAIAKAANLNPTDLVLEIGPGRGILTEQLVKYAGEVVAVEKDRELVKFLEERFAASIRGRKLKVIESDILTFDTSNLSGFKVVGNIPYNITGEIFRSFLESSHQPSSMTLMVQKEVGERIMARDGKESILSISVKAYGKPSIVRKVPAGSFNPKPKVDSVVIHIEGISKDFFSGKARSASGGKNLDEKQFFSLLKTGFAHKRKYLLSNLALKNSKFSLQVCFDSLALSGEIRAEALSLEDWEKLAHCLATSS